MRVKANRANRVIIARYHVVDAFRGTVRVYHGNHRDAQLPGFLDRDIFMVNIDHEHGVGQAFHVFDAAEAAFQLFLFAGELEHLFLDQVVQSALFLKAFKVFQPFD